MSEYDSLVEGYEGLGSPGDDPGPLTAEEEQVLVSHGMIINDQKTADAFDEILGLDEPEPFVEGDGFDPPAPAGELRVLKPDQLPKIGQHYVIVDGVPRPVVRDTYSLTEDEHVREQLGDISDHVRAARAARTLRLRYRRYLAGESANL